MNELQKLIEKWDEQIALHRRVCEDPLMYTKEERLRNSHYVQAICAVVADLKKLTIPDVRFQLPSDEQLINIAILFNDGKLEAEKLSDMVGMCQFVIDRLYENGDIMKPSSKEGN